MWRDFSFQVWKINIAGLYIGELIVMVIKRRGYTYQKEEYPQ